MKIAIVELRFMSSYKQALTLKPHRNNDFAINDFAENLSLQK
jgi:hypothetical protein